MAAFDPSNPSAPSGPPRSVSAAELVTALPRHMRRATRPDYVVGVATTEERAVLVAAPGGAKPVPGPRAQDYLAWRRSALGAATLFLAGMVVIGLVEIIIQIAKGNEEGSGFRAGLWHTKSFVELAAKALLAWMTWLGYLRWTSLGDSHRKVRLGWIVSFLVPFTLALLPMSVFLDIQAETGEQRQARDIIHQLIGMVMGLVYFMFLMPSLLAVFLGAIRGALAVKLFAPESAIPGWIAVVAAPFFALLALAIFVVVNQVGGNVLLLLGFAAITLNYLFIAFGGRRLARPHRLEEVSDLMKPIRARALVLGGAGAVLLTIALFTLTLMGLHLFGFGDTSLASPFKYVEIVLELVGKSMLTAVLVADLLLALIRHARTTSAGFATSELGTTLAARLDELEAAGYASVGSAAPKDAATTAP